MSAWKVSPILAPFIAEVVREFPGIVIGTIGDPAHKAEATGSDHNPDEWDWVCAADVMFGHGFGPAEAEHLFDRLTALLDSRMAYVIYNRRIVSTTVSPGKVRPYPGTDPHTGHVHVSVKHAQNPRPTTTWDLYPKAVTIMDEQSIASKLGADLNTDASGIAKGVVRQVDRALADNLAELNSKLDQVLAAVVATTPPVE